MEFMEFVVPAAALGYLLQKVFLLIAEGNETAVGRRWRISAWIAYLIGLPMWMIIFYVENNWILAFVEGSGVASMIFGLTIAIRGRGNTPKWLNYFAVSMTFVGISVSLYRFGGLVTLTQILELCVAIGFLIGTYFLAKKNPVGWLWYLLMNGSAGTLMWVQDYPLLTIQQSFSFVVVIVAYLKTLLANKRQRAT